MQENKGNRWLVVFGAILIQLCLGAIYAWSVFTPYLTKAIAEGGPGWSKVQTQIVFSVGLVSFALVMVLAGKKLGKIGPRRLSIISAITMGLGYVLGGLFGGTSFWPILIFVGLIGGGGIGISYVVPIAVGIRWFPDKKGLISGLAVAGFGFGAMIWVKLAGEWGHLIDNYSISTTFIVYGISFAVLILIGSIWMVFPKEEKESPGAKKAANKAAVSVVADIQSGAMLRTLPFYLIFLVFVFNAMAGLMSIGLMKLYPMEALRNAGLDDIAAKAISGTAMAVFFSLANGLGRILWGIFSDKLKRKPSIIIMAATQGAFMLLFPYMAGTPWMLYLAATLIGFNYGGAFALFPTITADTFGSKFVGENYPFVFLAYGVGGIFGPILGGVLGDMGNFPLAFSICGILCLISAAMTIKINPPSHA